MEEHKIGDKVRIKTGAYAGQRGCVIAFDPEGTPVIRTDANQVTIQPSDFTNYSLAARRAWQVMPKRAGRPPISKFPKKMVSVRLETEVISALQRALELGLIASKEEAVNTWVKRRLQELNLLRDNSDS